MVSERKNVNECMLAEKERAGLFDCSAGAPIAK
jgi:hypothetical protein